MNRYKNPFLTSGYISAEYFCDRVNESQRLIKEITNSNNLALISPRRMGKTGLIKHCFNDPQIQNHYYTFFVDIYTTKSLKDFVFALSKVILEGLQPFGKKALQLFWDSVKSLQTSISFDISGNPSVSLGMGDIRSEEKTLDEIFQYLNAANKPCIVAIDEFQQIASYEDGSIEALLRTYIQHCNNAHFIFAGSQRHVMGTIFLTASRPFYQSVSILHLESIPIKEYVSFAKHHFSASKKEITAETIEQIYHQFNGITWYIQKMLHTLYSMTEPNSVCTESMAADALSTVLESLSYFYDETLYRLPIKQKETLIALAKEGKTKNPTGASFIKKHHLTSASSVQSALKVLLEKDFVTQEQGTYEIYDHFFGLFISRNY